MFEERDGDELSERLENGIKIEQMLSSAGFKLFAQGLKNYILDCEKKLRFVNPEKPIEILRLQILIQICDDIIPGIINNLKQDGLIAFKEIERRKEAII